MITRMQSMRNPVRAIGPFVAATFAAMFLVLFAAAPGARAQTASAPGTNTVSATASTPATAQAAAAVKKSPAPTKEVDAKSCGTADCHPEVKDYKVVHGPVNVDACSACHKLTNAATHKYELARPTAQLCTFCHKLDIPADTKVHSPVKTGDCLGCHNPHGGKTAKFIRGQTMRETCDKCHKDVVGAKTHVHGPVAAGVCEACHSPHASKFPKLLVVDPKTLCLSCHKEMGDQLKTAKVAHKPVVDGDCLGCHDAHASDYKMQIKAEPFVLCTSCHEHDKIKQMASDSKVKHLAVTQDQACLNCHTPHGGPLAKLMKAQPVDLCIKCHKDDLKAPDGRIVKAVPEVIDPKLTKHGPVRDGTCSGCHEVHGSEVSRLLAKPNPETFYAKFDPDNFALCFSCHDKKLVEAKDAEGLTGFRNGTQNLHFAHVNKEKGRTCRACHEKHASPNPLLIRDAVPYGQWDLPVNYKKTATGGSCAPGCHKEYRYDRINAADNGLNAVAPAATINTPTATSSPVTTNTPAPTTAQSPSTATTPAPAPVPTPAPPASPATVPAPPPHRTLSLPK